MKARNVDTGEMETVFPLGILSPDLSSLYIVDGSTDGGLALDIFHDGEEWALWPDASDADEVGYVYDEDEDAWERKMNEELSQYGLALGEFDASVNGYWLNEL